MKIFSDKKDVWLCVIVSLAIAMIAQWVLTPLLGFWPAICFVLLFSAIAARITLAIADRRDSRDEGKRRAS